MDCLFCKIVKGEIPTEIIYRDDLVIAIDDINPHAPQHKLIIPHKHIATLNDADESDTQLLGHMLQTAKKLAKKLEIDEAGYRVVMNCNAGGGQTVFHIHLHILGERKFNWPPG